MPMIFDTNKPIYQQIIEFMKGKLSNGEYLPGTRIPSVREFALYFKVNPNTVQKALSELERNGYFVSERTSGRHVTQNLQLIESLKAERLEELILKFIQDMTALGIKPSEIMEYISTYVDRITESGTEFTTPDYNQE